VDARTDIYSLAATLYAMLTGKPPLHGATVEQLIEKIRLDTPPRLAAYKLEVPEELEKVLRQCLAKRPQDRPASATELRKELEKIAQEHKIPL
jgi:serine/threonine protein kinase